MRLLLALILLLHLGATTTAKESDDIAKLCSALTSATACSSTNILLPAARLTYGDVPFFKPNPCKSKLRYGFGWTCLPGTDRITIRVPTGIEFYQKKKDLCEVIRRAVPNLDEVQKKGGAICQCLPKLYALVDSDTVKQVFGSTSLADASSEVLSKFGELAQCAIDAGLNVQDNKADLENPGGALATTSKSVRIFRAAELDLGRYIALATSLAPCATGAGCSSEVVRGFFQDYLGDSEAALAQDAKALVVPWSRAFGAVETSLSALASTASDVGGSLSAIQADVEKIANDICPDAERCATGSLSAFRKEVTATIESSRIVADAQQLVVSTAAAIEAITRSLNEAVAAFDAITAISADALIDKVLAGQFGDFADLATGLKAAQRLPKLVEDLSSKLPQAQRLAERLAQTAPAFADSLQRVLAENWLSDYEGDAAAAGRVEDQVFAIQTSLAKLTPQVTQVFASVGVLVDVVGTAVSDPSSLNGQVDFGVASYQRYSRGSFDAPCLTTGKWTVSLGGFTKTIDYPKFYRCRQKYRVPFPNQHIPYFRLRLPDNSPLVQIADSGGDVRAPSTSISWSGAKQTVSGRPASTVAVTSTTESTVAPSTTPATPSSREEPSSSSNAPVESASSTLSDSVSTSATITPTPSAARRRRVFGRQDTGDPDLDFDPASFAPPPDPTTTVAQEPPSETGLTTDEAAASSSAAAQAPAPTVLFFDTTIAGTPTTATATQPPSGDPTATEVQPDPPAPTSMPTDGVEIDLLAEVSEGSGTSVVSTWSEVATASVDVAVPSGATQSSAGSSTSASTAPSATQRTTTSLGHRAVDGECVSWLLFLAAGTIAAGAIWA